MSEYRSKQKGRSKTGRQRLERQRDGCCLKRDYFFFLLLLAFSFFSPSFSLFLLFISFLLFLSFSFFFFFSRSIYLRYKVIIYIYIYIYIYIWSGGVSGATAVVLEEIPFVIPFNSRVELLYRFIEDDKKR